METGLSGDYVLHPADLRGIVLGAQMDSEVEASIRRLVAERYCNAIVYRAHIDQSTRTISAGRALQPSVIVV